jgi:hypothetical protein
MPSSTFDAPELGAVLQKVDLGPETMVGVRFRGGPPIHDQYDAKEYILPPVPAGWRADDWLKTIQPASDWRLPFALAQHLRRRNFVPGTREPWGGGKTISRLAIIWTPTGKQLDPETRWAPFTREEIAKFGYHEAIDRSKLPAADQAVKLVPVSGVLSQGVDVTFAHDPAAFAPDAGEGLREAAHGERAAQAEGETVSRTRRGRTQFKPEPKMELP